MALRRGHRGAQPAPPAWRRQPQSTRKPRSSKTGEAGSPFTCSPPDKDVDRADTVGAGREAGPPSLLSPLSLASGSVRAREGGPVMSVYVGIDVHRKRSQVAVIDQDGQVLANRNVPNGAEPILKVIGGLPAAFEACYGTSWLVELLEDYGCAPHLVHPSRCKAIASARLKN